jgi:aspartyl-tRNA(Asn)/glutamyl-tRNA(Gln) amidotransferase subunit A
MTARNPSVTSQEARFATIGELAPRVRAGDISPIDLVRSCLDAIERHRDGHAFITVMADSALRDAERASEDIARGAWRGPLHGIPISVKDLVDVAGTPTTSGSALPPLMPNEDAPIVQRLRAAGAIVIGKTNLHEFAFGTTSDETAFGAVQHPTDPSRSAGGSSGGAAAALALGLCVGAVGTDTGGSIRIPSTACGTVGLKPTLGELPTDGIVPLSATLDHVGPMTRSVADAAIMLDAMHGRPAQTLRPAEGTCTFGIPGDYFCERLDPGVRDALERVRAALSAQGHRVIDVQIDHVRWTPDVYLHIVLPEASWYHAEGLARFADRYSPSVRLRLEMGGYVLAEDYVRAMRLRDVLRASVDSALRMCDALLLPGLPIPAPPIGAASVDVDGVREPVRAAMLRLTQLFNITGHPAIALPAGTGADALPRGIQLVGKNGQTERLLAIAISVEEVLNHRAPYTIGGEGSVGGGTGITSGG